MLRKWLSAARLFFFNIYYLFLFPEFYECCASGDPHYELFDGQWIHFQGQCKYLMAGTCHNCTDCDYEAFHVFVDNRPWAHNPARSVTDLVEIHFAGYIVTFQNGATNPLVSLRTWSHWKLCRAFISNEVVFECIPYGKQKTTSGYAAF